MADIVRGRLPWKWWEVLFSLCYAGVYARMLSSAWMELDTLGPSVRTVFSLALTSLLALSCLFALVASFVFRVDTLRLTRDFIRVQRGSSLWRPHQVQTTKAEKGFFLLRVILLMTPFCHALAERLANLQKEGGTFLAIIGVVAAAFLFLLYVVCCVLLGREFWGRGGWLYRS